MVPLIWVKETDIVTLPIQHDSAAELAQPLDVRKDWKKGECDLIPGKTAPTLWSGKQRDYPALPTLHPHRPADGENPALAVKGLPNTQSE